MKFINTLRDGDRVSGVYLCKNRQSATTKNGKTYDNVTIQDKTGSLDGKIWDPNSYGIEDFGPLDYVDITGEIVTFNNALQLNIRRARIVSADDVNKGDYLPVSEFGIEDMYKELIGFAGSVKNPWLRGILEMYYVKDKDFVKKFKTSSAAKSVHHGFVGGLLEHTLSVTKMCSFYCQQYPVLNRDLLITAAIMHDAGKTRELSTFPENDYTDDGQLLGHIMIGAEMIHDAAVKIPGFPAKLEAELKHCILAHHGEYEYGSPKKPALAEAMALNLADNTDARMETMKELFAGAGENKGWLGYNRIFESNIRKTSLGE